MENGEIGTVGEIQSEMLAKLKDSFQNKVFTVLSTIWNGVNTPDNFVDVGGVITAAVLEDAIDRINQTTSGVKAVVGVRSAMTPITKFAGFWSDGTNVGYTETALEEIRNKGYLGKYYGADLIMLDQEWDNPEDYNTMIPTDKILVLGDKIGEFITYGDVKVKNYSDMRPTPPQWFLELYQQFGLLIWKAQGLYVIGGLS